MNDLEMIKIVEDYIFKCKGVKITINQPDNLTRTMLLIQAYNIAKENI